MAERLLAAGQDDNTTGRWRRADRHFVRALAATDGHADLSELRVRIQVSHALALLPMHGPDAALDLLARAHIDAEACGSAYGHALADIQKSVVLLEIGAWVRGLQVLRTIDLQALRSPKEQMAVLLNRGLAELTLLDLDGGRCDLEAALALAIEQQWPELEFKAQHNLGCLEHVAGRHPAAIALIKAADAMPVDVDRVRSKHDYGRVLLEAGLIDEARAQLRDALARARSERLKLDEGEIRLDLARTHLLENDLVAAATETRSAKRAFEARHDSARSRSAELLDEAIRVAHTGSVAPPRDSAVLDPNSAQDRLAGRLRAEALLATDPAAARQALAALRPRREGIAPLMYDQLLTARAEFGCGDAALARRILRNAAHRLALQRSQLQSLEARAATAIHGRRLAAFDLDLAVAKGTPAALFDCIERWRAPSYRVDASAADDPTARDLLTRLRLARHIAGTPEEDPERATAAREEAADLEARIAEHLWSASSEGTNAASRPVPYATVRERLLDRGDRLLSFVVHDGDYVRLAVGSQRSRVDRLAPATVIDTATRQLLDDLRARAHAHAIPALVGVLDRAVAVSAAALAGLLLAGLRLDDAPGSVVIGPSPGLVCVPWSLLPGLRGRPVVVAPSVTRWARDSGIRRGPVSVASVAGPDLETADTEACSVGQTWRESPFGGDSRTYERACAATMVEAMKSAEVVHVAAHGLHEEQNPAFSSIRLVDGPLYVHELPRPPAAEHVVLSACEVGRSRMRADAEPLGLAAGLLAIGVRSVIASVAPVRDEVASTTMQRYHSHLASGRSAGAALAAAIGDEPEASTFCVYGADWQVSR